MNFLSKDASLQESITTMKAVLADAGCETVFSQEKHPLKHCYSVNLTSTEAPEHIYANGKGILSEASMASALGEYIERLQTNNFFTDFHLPNRSYFPDQVAFDFGGAYLSDELLQIYDPSGELEAEDLVDYNSDHEETIITLPFIQKSNGKTIHFPLNILNNLYVSNGLASGNTPQEAQVQALSEIFERHAKIEIIKNGYALPKIPDETIQALPRLLSDISSLREQGFIVEVLDASLGGRFPVTAISLINPKNASLFVSFGAHPILEVALERTMTELMQGRELDNLDAFEVPTFDMSLVSDSFNLESHFIDSNGKIGFGFLRSSKSFSYMPWNYKGDSCTAELTYLTAILKKMDKEIYLREYSYLGFYSCQMIVPGVSEIYPMDDLLYNNKNRGKWIRDMILDFTNYDPENILEEIDSLDDFINVETYIGVIFAKNFTMLEFRAQIQLLLGLREDALPALESGTDKLGHVVAELIRMEQENLPWPEYKEALCNIFGQERVEKARSILAGKEYLISTKLHSDYYNMLTMYDRLELKKKAAVTTIPG